MLTQREREVALAVANGLTSKQIGKALGLSELTVRKHRENIHRKLGIRNLAELARYCLENL